MQCLLACSMDTRVAVSSVAAVAARAALVFVAAGTLLSKMCAGHVDRLFSRTRRQIAFQHRGVQACDRVFTASLPRLYRICTRRFTAFPGIERQYVVLQFALLIADEWCASR